MAKRIRGAEELEALARAFAADWRGGDRVMTWLRRHEGRARELSRLIDDGWSWADISRAMFAAGITYQRSGAPIPPALLCRKAYEARNLVLKRSRKQVPRPAATTIPAAGQAAGPRPAAAVAQHDAASGQELASLRPPELEEAPEFRPARLAGWSGRTTHAREEATRDTPSVATSPAPTGRADAVISRLMNRK